MGAFSFLHSLWSSKKGQFFFPQTLGCIFLSPFIPGLRKGSIFLSQFILGFSFPHSLRESTRSLWGPQGVHFPPSIHSGGPQKVAYILPHSFRTFTPGFFPPGDPGGCFGGLAQCSPGAVPAGTPGGGGRGGEGEYRGRAARHVPRRRRRALLLVEAAANERRRLFAPEGG